MNDEGLDEELGTELDDKDLSMGDDGDEVEEEEDPLTMGFHEDGGETETDY